MGETKITSWIPLACDEDERMICILNSWIVKCHLWSSHYKTRVKGHPRSSYVGQNWQFLNQKLKRRLTDSPKNDRENQNWGHSKVISRSFWGQLRSLDHENLRHVFWKGHLLKFQNFENFIISTFIKISLIKVVSTKKKSKSILVVSITKYHNWHGPWWPINDLKMTYRSVRVVWVDNFMWWTFK